MNRRDVLRTGTCAAAALGLPALAMAQGTSAATGETTPGRANFTALQGPIAPKRPVTITQLGRTRTDNYAWLRAPNWQEVINEPSSLQGEIRTHIEAENSYTKAVFLDPTQKLRDDLFAELRGKVKEDDSSVPAPDGAFAYYTRFREGGQYPVVARRPLDAATREFAGPEQVLIDGDREARGKPFWRLQNWEQNPQHDIFAYAVDLEGGNSTTMRFKVAATGSDLPYQIEKCDGSLVWAPDGRTCFYTLLDDNFRAAKVMRHVVGEPDSDVLIYEEKNPAFQMGTYKSASGDYLFILRARSDATEVRYLPLATPTAAPRVMATVRDGLEYYPDHHGEHFYIRTNKDGATDFKIMRAPVARPAQGQWRDYIPHEAGRFIDSAALYKDHMVLGLMVDALPKLRVRDMAAGTDHDIAFPEEAYDVDVLRGFEWATRTLRFTYNSPSTPTETWDYDMAARTRVLRKRQEIPSGHDKENYVVRRIVAVADDGARVPVTILHHKDTPIDGAAPCLLYGYGSYGISMPANFSISRLPLVDRGLVYAIAHIRGGQERGQQWYLDGKLMKKMNTFTDFIRAAETLVEQRFAAPRRIVIEGRSAGGLLVGAVMNMRPELFAGVIGGVAFVDVINTISDGELPLTPPEWTEWGNPITDAAAYDYMMSYSPYDQVGAKPYPPLLAQTALSDSQVTYWEPAKWVAHLREKAPDFGPYLLHVNMEAGHAGASGRLDRLKEVAESHAFALWCLGMA
jgi:oligopeptidase B